MESGGFKIQMQQQEGSEPKENCLQKINKMKKIKLHLACFFISIIVIVFIFHVCIGYPIIIRSGRGELISSTKNESAEFNPLVHFNFEDGGYCAYLYFPKVDQLDLPTKMPHRKLFICCDPAILKKIKENFTVLRLDGDMTTCESEFLLYKNSNLVLSLNIVLTDDVLGIQDSANGWCEATDFEELKDCFFHFQPVQSLFFYY